MMICTLVSLFLFDLDIAFWSKDADLTVVIITVVCIFIFGLELILSVIAKPGYLFSFFMFVDLVGTLSLVPDILEISNLLGDNSPQQITGSLQTSRAGRVGRVARTAGSLRFTRFIRLFRVVRLIRIARVFKFVQESPGNRDINATDASGSRLGITLSDTVSFKEETSGGNVLCRLLLSFFF